MKERKKSLGTFETEADLRDFLEDDNERVYEGTGYKRQLKIHTVGNAYIKERNGIVWFYSRGYGMQFVYSEEEKNRIVS